MIGNWAAQVKFKCLESKCSWSERRQWVWCCCLSHIRLTCEAWFYFCINTVCTILCPAFKEVNLVNTDLLLLNITSLYNLTKCPHFCRVGSFLLISCVLHCLREQTETWRSLRLVHEELNQQPDDVIIETHHLSVLHRLVQSQALGSPQQVLPGVVDVCLHGEGQCVELVAEEGEEVTVGDDSLGHERPGDVLVVPETCRGEREVRRIHILNQHLYQIFVNTSLLYKTIDSDM